MNGKEYYANIAKVYVYDPETKEQFGGPLTILESFLTDHTVGTVISISNTDNYDSHKDMFMNESDYNQFRFLLITKAPSLQLLIRSIEESQVEYPHIGTIKHSITVFEIIKPS